MIEKVFASIDSQYVTSRDFGMGGTVRLLSPRCIVKLSSALYVMLAPAFDYL
jgi:hypothetical protein